MKNRNWGNPVEIIGTVSIVSGLVLVAWEINQANNIAKPQIVMELATQANEFNRSTFESPASARQPLAQISCHSQRDCADLPTGE